MSLIRVRVTDMNAEQVTAMQLVFAQLCLLWFLSLLVAVTLVVLTFFSRRVHTGRNRSSYILLVWIPLATGLIVNSFLYPNVASYAIPAVIVAISVWPLLLVAFVVAHRHASSG
jgi:hypothetical protein